jgi:hypothetical protein
LPNMTSGLDQIISEAQSLKCFAESLTGLNLESKSESLPPDVIRSCLSLLATFQQLQDKQHRMNMQLLTLLWKRYDLGASHTLEFISLSPA